MEEEKNKLETSEEKYKTYINSSPLATFIADTKGKYVLVNPAAEKLLNYSKKELLTMSIPDIVFKHDLPLILNDFKLLQKNKKLKAHYAFRKKDGSKVLVSLNGFLLPNGQIMAHCENISKRVIAEERIIESENKLKNSIEQSGAGYFFIDTEGKFRKVNSAWLEMHKYKTEKEIIGKHFAVTQVSMNLKEAQKVVKNIINSKKTVKGEFSRKCKNRSIGYHNYTVSPVYENKKIIGLEGFLIDITEKKLAEDKIINSEAKLQTIVQNSIPIIYMLDAKGNFLLSEGKTLVALGLKPGEVVGKNAFTIYKGNKPIISAIKEALTGKNVKYETKIGQNTFESTVSPYKDSHGKVAGVVGTALDITHKKLAEEKIKASQEEYKSTLNDLVVGVVVHDSETKIILSNPRASNILGLTTDQMQGKDLIDPSWDFVDQNLNHVDVSDYPVSKVLQTKKPLLNYVIGINRPDRAYITWVIVNAIPLFSKSNELDKIIVNFTDITEQKKAEHELKESEKKYRELSENMEDVVYRMKLPEGIYEYVSASSKKIFGYSPDEFYKHPILIKEAIHPDFQNYFKKEWANLIKGNMPEFYEYKIIHKNKDVRWVSQHNTLIKDSNGNSIAIQGIVSDITERKKNEELLEESKERFRQLAEQSPFVYEVYDIDGLQIEVNKAYEDLWKFPEGRNRTVGKFNVLKSKEVEKTGLLVYVKKAYAGKTVTVPPYEYNPQGATEAKGAGRVRWLSTKIYPLKDLKNKVTNIVITHEDISETRKIQEQLAVNYEEMQSANEELATTNSSLADANVKQEETTEALIKSEEKRNTWIEASPACTKIVDLDLNLQFMSGAGITDLKIDDVTTLYGKPYPFHFYPKSFKDMMTGNLKKAKKTGKTIEQEAPVVDKKGNLVWFHSTIVPVKDYEGKVEYLLVVSIDTTSRNLARIELENQQKKLSQIVNGTNVPILVLNKDHVVTNVNPPMEKIGSSKDCLGKKNIWKVFYPKKRPILANLVISQAKDKEFSKYYSNWTKIKSPKGTYQAEEFFPQLGRRGLWLSFTATPIHDSKGITTGAIESFQDITESKTRSKILEEKVETRTFELKELSYSLEKKVDLRTKELTKANKEVEKTLREKTDFLNQVAHDLRTPLTPIQILLQIVDKDKAIKGKSKENLGVVNRNVQSLSYLVTNVLNLVRLDRRAYNVMQFNKGDLILSIKNIIKNNLSVFQDQGVKITSKFENDLPKVLFDEDKLNQVLGNIFSNSIKHFDKNKKIIKIEVLNNKNEILIKLSDNGEGIEKENLKKIFNEFFQVTQYQGGTSSGLGLAICNRIITLHGGIIWAESNGKGKGTTICFTIPLKPQKEYLKSLKNNI